MYIMKKINKLQVNPERLMKNEELMTLRGGYGSYKCFMNSAGLGCEDFRGYINTASCHMAYDLCWELYGGGCVCGGECVLC